MPENREKTPDLMKSPLTSRAAMTNPNLSTPQYYAPKSGSGKRRDCPTASDTSASSKRRQVENGELRNLDPRVDCPSLMPDLQGPTQISLVDRTIEIRLSHFGDDSELNSTMVIAIPPIIRENCRQLPNEDIRVNHLDFSLFKCLMADMAVYDERFDIEELDLWYHNLIADEDDFLRAIGVQDTRLRALGMTTPVVFDLKSNENRMEL